MRSRTLGILWLLAVAVAVGVAIGNWLVWDATSRVGRFLDAPGVTATQSILAAAPFLIFAAVAAPLLRRTDSKIVTRRLLLAALEALVVTAALWALYFHDGYLAQTAPSTGSGANIGLGMLMLFSPLIAALPLVVGYRGARAAAPPTARPPAGSA